MHEHEHDMSEFMASFIGKANQNISGEHEHESEESEHGDKSIGMSNQITIMYESEESVDKAGQSEFAAREV